MLEAEASARREKPYSFPSLCGGAGASGSVILEQIVGGGRRESAAREKTGTTGATGGEAGPTGLWGHMPWGESCVFVLFLFWNRVLKTPSNVLEAIVSCA